MNDEAIKKGIQDYWNERSADYDASPGHGLHGEDEKAAWLCFLRSVLPGEGLCVLDAGCGTGFLTMLAAELGHTVHGVDLSEGMMADAKKKAEASDFSERISFAQGDVEHLADADETYDAVINRHLLWTLPHPYEAVTEWLRVLKPGGRVIVIDGNWQKRKDDKPEPRQEEKETHRGYSEEISAALPLRNGENDPVDFIRREGYPLRIQELVQVDLVERKKYPEEEWVRRKEYHRVAYLLDKPKQK